VRKHTEKVEPAGSIHLQLVERDHVLGWDASQPARVRPKDPWQHTQSRRTKRRAIDATQRLHVRLPHFRENLGAVLLQELDEVLELQQHILLQNLVQCPAV
jgi:hypothetical protein